MADLSVDIDANVSAAKTKIKDLGTVLGDVGDGFDDAGLKAAAAEGDIEGVLRQMVDLGRRGGDSLDDIAKAISQTYGVPIDRARRAIDMLGDETSSSLGEVVSDARRAENALDDIGTEGTKGFGRVKASVGEVSSEIGQNLGEAVSSFRGNLTDLGQVGQDTFGGLAATVAGLGPGGFIGALVLAAGAAGLGAIVGGIEAAADKQEALNEKAGEFARVYANSAGQIADAAAVVAGVLDIQNDPEKYRDAAKAAEEWGTTVPTAMRAIAGDATALQIAQSSLQDKTREYVDTLSPAEQKLYELGQGFQTLSPQLQDGADRLSTLGQAVSIAKSQVADGARALYDIATASGVASGETDDLGNAIYNLPDGKQIVVNAQTQTAYENIDALEQKKLSDKTATLTYLLNTKNIDQYTPPNKIGVVNYKAAQTAFLQ